MHCLLLKRVWFANYFFFMVRTDFVPVGANKFSDNYLPRKTRKHRSQTNDKPSKKCLIKEDWLAVQFDMHQRGLCKWPDERIYTCFTPSLHARPRKRRRGDPSSHLTSKSGLISAVHCFSRLVLGFVSNFP